MRTPASNLNLYLSVQKGNQCNKSLHKSVLIPSQFGEQYWKRKLGILDKRISPATGIYPNELIV